MAVAASGTAGAYGRSGYDAIEEAWAFHTKGRACFLSPIDFRQVRAWELEGIAVTDILRAIELWSTRRVDHLRRGQTPKLAWVDEVVRRHGRNPKCLASSAVSDIHQRVWSQVPSTLQGHALARESFFKWQAALAELPFPDSPGRPDAERIADEALNAFLSHAEPALGSQREALRCDLRRRLLEARIPEDGIIWTRAWRHHWTRAVLEALNLSPSHP